jgi:WD40 repeat protein
MRNGAGVYSLPSGNPVSVGQTITDTLWNTTFQDVANALTQSMSIDGQAVPTNNQNMATFRHTNVGNALLRTDYAAFGQVQDGVCQWLTSVAGTDTITGALSAPVLTALVSGQSFRFQAAGANTTNTVTLNINSLGAKSVKKHGGVAMAPGDIQSGQVIYVVYDGTNFQVVGVYSLVSDSAGNVACPAGFAATTGVFTGLLASSSIILTGSALPTNGWYLPSANTVGLATNSVQRLTCNGTGNIVIANSSSGVPFTVSGEIDDVAGDVRNIQQNSQSAAYTLVISDKGKSIYHPSADTTARVWTIPANASVAFPVGTAVTFINDTGAGTITIAITSDTLKLAGPGTTGSRTLLAGGMATAIKITATSWLISGVGLS